LIEAGVSESRLKSYGASEMFPIIHCETSASCTEEEHQTNRRSVANILHTGERVVIHRVKSGDTLYGLNRKYGVSYEQIKSWNALSNNSLRPGQDVLIYLP
jgi:LysM repeat protein